MWSNRQIAAKIQQEFKLSKKLADTTILGWARKYGWNELLEKAAKAAVIKVAHPKTTTTDPGSDQTQEEKHFETITEAKRQLLDALYHDIETLDELIEKKRCILRVSGSRLAG